MLSSLFSCNTQQKISAFSPYLAFHRPLLLPVSSATAPFFPFLHWTTSVINHLHIFNKLNELMSDSVLLGGWWRVHFKRGTKQPSLQTTPCKALLVSQLHSQKSVSCLISWACALTGSLWATGHLHLSSLEVYLVKTILRILIKFNVKVATPPYLFNASLDDCLKREYRVALKGHNTLIWYLTILTGL